jgi:type I restriction enzyme S subunit
LWSHWQAGTFDDKCKHWVNQSTIPKEALLEAEIPLPPLAEQRRIVAKLEELLGKVSSSQQRLARVPGLLKRFRQSVLAAACSGRLTADWREENDSSQHGADVVEGIRKRRESKTKNAAAKAKLAEIYAAVEESDSANLPEPWRFVALNKLCDSFDYGTSAKSKPEGKVPVLRMGNIQQGRIDWGDLVFASDEDEIASYALKPNTVLFNRTNSPELVGKTAIYRGERPAIFAGYLIRMNPCEELDPEYLNLCLNSNDARVFCNRVKTDGVSQSNINAQKLGTFEVPYCPLDEQQEIVRRVERLFRLADQIEARLTQAQTHVARLTQSLLAKAFRGAIVPTEAELARRDGRDYEPACALLERIRREREDTETIHGVTRPKRRGYRTVTAR